MEEFCLETRASEEEGKEKKAAGGKGGDRPLVLPCLYPTSNSEAESWTQSPVWSEPSEHNANVTMRMQHLILRKHTHTQPGSIPSLASYLELSSGVPSNIRKDLLFSS